METFTTTYPCDVPCLSPPNRHFGQYAIWTVCTELFGTPVADVAPCCWIVCIYPFPTLPPLPTACTDSFPIIIAGTCSIEWIDLGQGRGALQGQLDSEIVHFATLSPPFDEWKVLGLRAALRPLTLEAFFCVESGAPATPEGVSTAGAASGVDDHTPAFGTTAGIIALQALRMPANCWGLIIRI